MIDHNLILIRILLNNKNKNKWDLVFIIPFKNHNILIINLKMIRNYNKEKLINIKI